MVGSTKYSVRKFLLRTPFYLLSLTMILPYYWMVIGAFKPVEEQVKNDLNVTVRCIPEDAPREEGRCVISGEPSERRVVFAKAY